MFGFILLGVAYIGLSLFAFRAVLFPDSRFVAFVDRLAACRREAGFPPRGTCYPRVS